MHLYRASRDRGEKSSSVGLVDGLGNRFSGAPPGSKAAPFQYPAAGGVPGVGEGWERVGSPTDEGGEPRLSRGEVQRDRGEEVHDLRVGVELLKLRQVAG